MLGIYCRTSREKETVPELSTIVQQKIAGVKFAEDNNFEYDLYEDEGKSGFKISDDDLDPFNFRPAFASLINDIKNGKIDKVWVWEHSRLSRNQYASAFIFNVFEKFNIVLYENKKQFDMNDPQIKMTRQILDAVSEYERHLIVNRTVRGSLKQFSEGRKTYPKLFCYVNGGRNEKGHVIWKPVESEIETYKYILKRYKEGASLRKIVFEVYNLNNLKPYQFGSYAAKMGYLLRKYQYTGYQLTEEGNDIFKRFRKYEINSIQVLKEKKYWVKSIPYPLELISINEWVDITESLQIRGLKMNFTKKDRVLRASRDIGTGIIKCGDCEARFYYKEQQSKLYSDGHRNYYYTYFHRQGFQILDCKQLPKSFKIEDINEIMKIFYFYFKVVFDNRNELIQESQRNIKHKQIKVMEDIAKNIKLIEGKEKYKTRLQKALENPDDESDDTATTRLLVRNISEANDQINEINISLSKLKIENELLSEKFSQNLLEITYYDVTEKINNWFYNMSIEEQRNELIRVIKSCKVYNHYMMIEAGTIVFIFDIDQHYIFDMDLLENMNRDIIFKKNFVQMKGKRDAKKFNDMRIPEIDLITNKEIKLKVFEYLIQNFNIYYNFIEVTKLISFVPLRGLWSTETEELI